jgi:hypothetical protein
MSSRVRLVKTISFDDLRRGVIAPIDAYKIQVQEWIISPGRRMAATYPGETDHGIALLALELMFFEPHGQFLQGAIGQMGSARLFCLGFDRFRRFLKEKHTIAEDIADLPTKKIYEWARCGLFHSLLLGKELLVDAVKHSRYCIDRNNVLGGWLVDPWRLLDAIESYVAAYVAEVKSGNNVELAKNFESTFTKLFFEPMDYFLKVGG